MYEQDTTTAMLARARRGAAFIDAQLGKRSWRRRVSRRALSMGLPCRCVVGQLYGNYDEGAERLGSDPYGPLADEYGFTTPLGDWSALTEAWKIVLRERAVSQSHT